MVNSKNGWIPFGKETKNCDTWLITWPVLSRDGVFESINDDDDDGERQRQQPPEQRVQGELLPLRAGA